MANPEFTVTYRIDGNWQNYSTFIQNLRGRVADPNAELCRGLSQLPPENPNTTQSRQRWISVILQTNDTSITLRIRRENLYVDAYRRGNTTWVEFASTRGRLYPNSVLLQNNDGSYPQLEAGTPGRSNIPLTLDNLTLAVNMLAELDGRGSDARMYQIVVVQMISESIRLHSITQYLASGHATAGAPAWMIGREGSWARLSRILYANSADRFQPYDESQEFINETQIWSYPDVINALGILKPEPRAPNTRFPRMAQDYDFGGGPKVEVFEFRINKTDEDLIPAQLYGSIKGNQVFIHNFYDRDNGHTEPVNAGDFPLLMGPKSAAMSACDTFKINVDLLFKKNSGPPYTQCSRGYILWNTCNLDSSKVYDKFIQDTFPGDDGCSATIRYGVFSDAVGANIEVKLINGDGEDPAQVYGNISAANTRVIEGESVLFRKGKDGRMDIRPGQVIPLSRAIVAVPINSNFHVRAKLYDYDSASWDDEIANGTARFKPKRYGTDVQKISGQYGEIEVKITWKI
ncbi:uncharacterized protein LOC130808469 [Amaranthus tricolor]|uniref:uncharacterized protein LOC130808469 n=1 Tax=Amaranthus tricolor TaxID=29722 RepID=UPI00258E681A|nr:uncharacterized protein LOC130808469 [Amaranthus tricolor]